MSTRSLILIVVTWLMTGPAPAWAHKPIFSDGSAVDAERAIVIDDVSISYVAYHEVRNEATQLWLTFEADAGQKLWAQLGVPYIDRLEGYRPTLVLLGPGLPEVDLPISVPDGLGGVVLRTDEIEEPEFFHEPFTGTDSWILGAIEETAPQAGRYYLVAFVPDGQPGKLWVAPGRKENFGLGDILSLPAVIQKVRAFHEVKGGIGVPCLFPVAAAGLLLAGGLRLVRNIQRRRRLES